MHKETHVWTCDWCSETETNERYPYRWIKWNRTVGVSESADGGGIVSYVRMAHLCSLKCATAFIEAAEKGRRLSQQEIIIEHLGGNAVRMGTAILLDGVPIRPQSNPNQGDT